ncbi:MAG: hypothetical protein J7M24_05370, partial [Candidatus Latescibacteria bacterium]|nr:hypothetical protein [Candidatus Latescibacterota bacterium]
PVVLLDVVRLLRCHAGSTPVGFHIPLLTDGRAFSTETEFALDKGCGKGIFLHHGKEYSKDS